MGKRLFLAIIICFAFITVASADDADNIPKNFYFDQGTFIFGFRSLSLKDGKLEFYVNHGGEKTGIKTVTVTPAQWIRFREELDQIDVWSWSAQYEDKDRPADSLEWVLTLEYADGKSLSARGLAAYPEKYKQFENALNELTGENW